MLNRRLAPDSYYTRSVWREDLRYSYDFGAWGSGALDTPDALCAQHPAGTASGQISAGRVFSCPIGYALRDNPPDGEECSRPLHPEGQTCPAAYPVQPDTGVKRLDEDYDGAGAHSLSFTRSYRSSHSLRRPERVQLGAQWSTPYGAQVQRGQTYTSVHRGDGSAVSFRTDTGTVWTSAWGPRATLATATNTAGAFSGWTLRLDDDDTETYDADGALQTIRQRNGWTTTLTYSTAATPVADYLSGAATAAAWPAH